GGSILYTENGGALVNTREEETESPSSFSLGQNYPNPFNPATVISFQLTVSGYASLKVYNVLGQEVATLVDETMQAGMHEFMYEVSNLASGVYIYRLQSGGNVATQRMTLMK
ncbi:MAG: T9SS type A sorting domain-containing protein, partial [bacterium]|nr:T9SS type A sorting domain-containing protein [bacterium]